MNGLARLPHGSLVQFGAVLGAVVVLCMLAAGLSAFGLPGHLVAYLFVFFGLVVVAVLCRHNTPNSVKGSGVAVSVEWLSAFGLFGIVGAVYVHGHDGLAILLGLVAGFVVSLLAIAPRLSRISAPSMPDFLEVRYESEALRYITLGVLTVVTMLFLAAQLAASGLIAVHIFQIPSVVGICVGAVVILALAISARRGTISSAQIIMAVTAIASVLLAGTWLLSAKTGIVVPHLAAGGLYSDIAAAETRLDLDARFADPFNGFGLLNALFLVVVLAIGSAVMPHLVARVVSVESPAKTQQALRRGLIAFVAVATILPALAVLARVELLALFVSAKNNLPVETFSDAVLGGLDTIPVTLSADQFVLDPHSVLMALPEFSQASDWMLGLFALFGLCVVSVAGASAAYGLADAISSRTSSLDAAGERSKSIVVVTIVAALLAAVTGLDVLCFGAWAYSLIGAALFAPLVMGLWWRRTTRAGAITGMLGGFVVTAIYIFGAGLGPDFAVGSGDEWRWFGATHLSAGVLGIAASVILTFAVSKLGEEPSLSQLDIMDRLDTPSVKVSPVALE